MTGPAVDPLADYQQGWQAGGSGDPLSDYHPDWRGGGYQFNPTAAARQRALGLPTAPDQATPQGRFFDPILEHVMNIAQGVPGAKRAEVYAGMLGSRINGNPMSYEQSQNMLNGATAHINPVVSGAEKFAGSLATLPAMPANPALAGAMFGGADAALSADQESLGERAGNTAVGAGLGAILGHYSDRAMQALSRLGVTKFTTNVLGREAAQSAAAGPLYTKALAEGVGKTNTPQINAMLQRPMISEIADGLLQTQKFAGRNANDPEVLDAIYKTLSDQAGALQKGLDRPVPSRPNIGRYELGDVRANQQDLMDAMAGGTSLPGPMPSYRQAVGGFARSSAQTDAIKTGASMVPGAKGYAPEMLAGYNKMSPESFAQWAAAQTPEARALAAQGIRGAVKSVGKYKAVRVAGLPLFPVASDAVKQAPALLRTLNPASSIPSKVGLLGLESLFQ